jgi:L,D-transpeptidase-like protein
VFLIFTPEKSLIRMQKAFWPAILLVSLFLITGCQQDARFARGTQYLTAGGRVITQTGQPAYDTVSHWDGDGVPGAPFIRISIHEQRAYFYKGSQLVGVSILSTGREGFNTPTGHFHIIQKDRDHVSSRFGNYVNRNGDIIRKDVDRMKDPMPKGARYDGASMPYFMRVVGGTGMHQGYLPGYPASHGCIRMPGNMAEAFFRNVELGTPVTISP